MRVFEYIVVLNFCTGRTLVSLEYQMDTCTIISRILEGLWSLIVVPWFYMPRKSHLDFVEIICRPRVSEII